MTSSTPSKPAHKVARKSIHKSQFLIVGYGDELRGDDAAGSIVVNTVDGWQLPSIKTIFTHYLTEALIYDVAAADYAIFVSSCPDSSRARTIQIDPIEQGNQTHQSLAVKDIHTCNPRTLIDLSQQTYGREPQAWFLQVPIANVTEGEDLSSTTQRGCDDAVRTIEQIFKTYRKPVWMDLEST